MCLTSEDKVYIWLASFHLDESKKHALLKKAGSPRALVKNLAALLENEPLDEDEKQKMLLSVQDNGEYFQSLLRSYEKDGICCVPLSHPSYPTAFKTLSHPPLCLYLKGEQSLLNEQPFCIVGSRRTAEQTMKLTARLAQKLSEQMPIITGVADGGDNAAAEGALKGSKRVVLFCAGGFEHLPKNNHNLLKEVEKHGLILSACPLGQPVYPFSYERRNELLAALCRAVLIVSAGEKSGALITAKYAAAFQKTVFALPYPPSSSTGCGCNALIKNGAILTETEQDIFSALGITPKKAVAAPELSEKEQQAYEIIKAEGELPVAALAQRLGVPAYLLAGTLTALEVKGLIAKTGGNKVAPVR